MSGGTNVVDPTDNSVESIPVPPTPKIEKSSDEILSELFGSFNATPPPLDDIQVPEHIGKKSHDKKHKKQSKKKSKKVKKKKRHAHSKSRSVSNTKEQAIKKSSKNYATTSNLVSSKKKSRKKLGKFSASDESDEDILSSNENKANTKIEIANVNIKQEKVVITMPALIQESVLKEEVSKIVDKVIHSTKIKKEVFDLPKIIHDQIRKTVSDDTNKANVDDTQIVVKTEQSIQLPQNNVTRSDDESTEINISLEENIPFPAENPKETSNSEMKNNETDKPKPTAGKIKIQNLKFSQVYEATVKQIEEEAKRKAEKYEEGEITDTTTEEKSPTPSLPSSTESAEEVSREKSRERKRSHRHQRKKKSHHHKRSKSRERRNSHSRCRKRSSSRSKRVEDKQSSRSSSRERSRDRRRRIQHSRDRSSSRELFKGRRGSRSRERSRDRKRDESQSRDRSSDRIKRRRRSKDRSRSRDRKKEEHKNKIKSNSREKSKDRTKERKRSRERSSSIDDKNKKHKHGKDNKNKDKPNRNTEDKIDKQKLLEIARKNALGMIKGSALVEQNKVLSITAGGKTVSELTDFCKLLSKKDAEGHESISSETEPSSGSESENRAFHHPFQLKDRNAPIVLNIRNSVALPIKSHQEKTAEQARELRLQFPVSSGQHHRKTESEWVPVEPKKPAPLAITAPPPPPPPVRRRRTFTDTPEPPMIEWRETRREPQEIMGQFTGSTGVRVLTQAELASGQQAWARRDQLQVAAPVNSGMGMTLLQKMGWRPGEGLGKNKEGTLQPLLLEVKTDKKGLVAQEELPARPPHHVIRRTQRSLEGKHPVSLLNEYCSRRKYNPPCFDLIDEAGPDHKKNFRFKVKVNGIEYTPAVGSTKKKQARAEAAEICLKELGILPSR